MLCFSSYASEDLVSYCFEHTTNLKEAEASLSFLLLPKEKVFQRPKQNCFDILTSTNRANLLEKFLLKRYSLINEGAKPNSENLLDKQCQIELKKTKTLQADGRDIRLGNSNSARQTSLSAQEVSTSQLLLGSGYPGTLELEGRSLYIECRKNESGIFQLIFSYSEKDRVKVSSEISLKRGEVVQIAQITNDLDRKSRTLGLPQSLYQDQSTQGQENISYELKIN